MPTLGKLYSDQTITSTPITPNRELFCSRKHKHDTANMLKELGSGAAAGYLIHQFVKRVEIDKRPTSVVGCFIGGYFALAIGLRRFDGVFDNSSGPFSTAFLVETAAIISLFANILMLVFSSLDSLDWTNFDIQIPRLLSPFE
jgi:hypothetical protein